MCIHKTLRVYLNKVKIDGTDTKSRSVEGPYQPRCRDCAMYFSITIFFRFTRKEKKRRLSIQEFEHPDLFWSLSSCMKPLMSIAQTEKTMASWRMIYSTRWWVQTFSEGLKPPTSQPRFGHSFTDYLEVRWDSPTFQGL